MFYICHTHLHPSCHDPFRWHGLGVSGPSRYARDTVGSKRGAIPGGGGPAVRRPRERRGKSGIGIRQKNYSRQRHCVIPAVEDNKVSNSSKESLRSSWLPLCAEQRPDYIVHGRRYSSNGHTDTDLAQCCFATVGYSSTEGLITKNAIAFVNCTDSLLSYRATTVGVGSPRSLCHAEQVVTLL